jgi:hypothetical protein
VLIFTVPSMEVCALGHIAGARRRRICPVGTPGDAISKLERHPAAIGAGVALMLAADD